MTKWRTSPLNEGFGVEIEGFDPGRDLDDGGRARLLELFNDRSILLFRDLDLDRRAWRIWSDSSPESRSWTTGMPPHGRVQPGRRRSETSSSPTRRPGRAFLSAVCSSTTT